MNSRQIIDYIQQEVVPALQQHLEELLGKAVLVQVNWASTGGLEEGALLQLQHYLERMHHLMYCNDLKKIVIQHVSDNSATKVWLQAGTLYNWVNLTDIEGIPTDSELQFALENLKV